jgi:hypothetical protein
MLDFRIIGKPGYKNRAASALLFSIEAAWQHHRNKESTLAPELHNHTRNKRSSNGNITTPTAAATADAATTKKTITTLT